MKQAFLFDYGGTLDGAASHWFDRFVELYRRLAVTRTADEIKTAFYAAEEELLADRQVRGWTLEETLNRHVATQLARLRLEDARLHERLIAGFLAQTRAGWRESLRVLRALAPRFTLAVVSNFYGNLEIVLRQAGLHAYLTAAVDSAIVGVRKPDRRIFALALEQLKMRPELSTFVGDSLARDILPAKDLGMRTIWLSRAQGQPSLPDRVDWQISSLAELLELPL